MKYYFSIDKDTLIRWWKKVKDSGNELKITDGQNFDQFQRVFLHSDAFVEFPFGVLRFNYMANGADVGYLHGFFWDRSVFKNVGKMREAIEKVGRVFAKEKIACVFPGNKRAIKHMLQEGGFKYDYDVEVMVGGEPVQSHVYVLQLFR